jgi:orotate phosphoribosyltransferase
MRSKQKEMLRRTLQQHTHYGTFDLSSGGTSDFYIDVRPVLLHSSTSRAVSMELLKRLNSNIDVVAGVGISGSLLVASLLAYTVRELKGLIVRKEERTHGLTRAIEGDALIHNCNIALVDDVLNRGSSLTFATRALKDLRHCNVVQWIVFVDRSSAPIEGAPEVSAVLTAAEILNGVSFGQSQKI